MEFDVVTIHIDWDDSAAGYRTHGGTRVNGSRFHGCSLWTYGIDVAVRSEVDAYTRNGWVVNNLNIISGDDAVITFMKP